MDLEIVITENLSFKCTLLYPTFSKTDDKTSQLMELEHSTHFDLFVNALSTVKQHSMTTSPARDHSPQDRREEHIPQDHPHQSVMCVTWEK